MNIYQGSTKVFCQYVCPLEFERKKVHCPYAMRAFTHSLEEARREGRSMSALWQGQNLLCRLSSSVRTSLLGTNYNRAALHLFGPFNSKLPWGYWKPVSWTREWYSDRKHLTKFDQPPAFGQDVHEGHRNVNVYGRHLSLEKATVIFKEMTIQGWIYIYIDNCNFESLINIAYIAC